MKKLVITLESKTDNLPIKMYLVQCPKCAYYFFFEENMDLDLASCANCQHPELTVVDCSPDTEHKFVGWGWEKVEG